MKNKKIRLVRTVRNRNKRILHCGLTESIENIPKIIKLTENASKRGK